MFVAIRYRDGETEDFFIDSEDSNVDGIMISLRDQEKTDLEEMPDACNTYGKYDMREMTREEYREWAEQNKPDFLEE